MLELTDWIARTRFPDKPWLVLGKGPTYSRRDEFDLGAYNLMSLNHVVNETNVEVAHIIDIDVVEACAANLPENCGWLLMPRVPHVLGCPSLRPLEDFVASIPVLRVLDEAGRLVWYNAETGIQYPGSPVIEVAWFSSVAALNLLATMGVKQIRSLGIDGGRSYSTVFKHLENSTRLANGAASFEVQFPEIERVVRLKALDYAPLIEPIRVFVGADESQLVAARVLEHSIRRNTDALVRISSMHEVMPPRPRKHKNRPRTPFTFTRFMVPELAGYHGKAIYLDADMQVFGDIRELADAPFGDHHLLCTTQNETPEAWRLSSWFHPGRQMSVMVLDCEALDWHVDEIVADLDAGRYSYADLLFRMCIVPADKIDGSLPAAWNHLERYEPGVTHLTHYTVGDYQPWRHPDNPLRDLWMGGYRQAVADGAVPPAEVERAISRGHVLPDLAHALSSAPAKPLADQSSAALELEAARFRIIELRNRQIRGRAVSLLKRLYPRVRKARELGPESLVANAVERAAYHFRRVLR